jgi:ribonucleoside-triphosphate reductase
MVIDFNNNLDNDFVANLEALNYKYGEDLCRLNGLSNDNLNFTSFIDSFTADNSKVVDISINPNANSDTKDVTSLIHNMAEPHCKLLAMNKIFYELKKKYGLEQAEKWLKSEWVGESYLHDFRCLFESIVF